MEGEWRILFVRLLGMATMAWGVALGYLIYGPATAGRIVALVLVIVGIPFLFWGIRKIRD